MSYELKFWNEYRADDLSLALSLETPEAGDLRTAMHAYYRLLNDGDTPHWATFQSLCSTANMIRWNHQRTDHSTQDDLIEVLLDRALASA